MHAWKRRLDGAMTGVAWALLALVPTVAPAHPAVDTQLRDLSARIETSPHDATLRLRRADLHLDRGAFDAARADLGAARQIDPDLPVVHVALARLELAAGRPAHALAAAEAFLSRAPASATALVIKARALAQIACHETDTSAAWLAALDAAEAARGAQPEHYLEAARASEAHPSRAVAILDRALSRHPAVPTLVAAAIAAERAAGLHDRAALRAREAAAAARERDLADAEWVLLEAEALAAAGAHDEARAAFSRAIAAVAAMPERAQGTRHARELSLRAQAGLTDGTP